ncbi:hypothetical protein [Rhodoferax sp.]|uniref:hypothetical protein n=1 Tax=Rhodoferax sp. TaxID=50421 RepID=UPI00262FB7D7|nr:hypothetical protein [Rhodoferax sp.]
MLEQDRSLLDYWKRSRNVTLTEPQYQEWRAHLASCVDLHNTTAALLLTTKDSALTFTGTTQANAATVAAQVLASLLSRGALSKPRATRLVGQICDYSDNQKKLAVLPPFIQPLWAAVQTSVGSNGTTWPATELELLFPRKLAPSMTSSTGSTTVEVVRLINPVEVMSLADDYQRLAFALQHPPLAISDPGQPEDPAFGEMRSAYRVARAVLLTVATMLRYAYICRSAQANELTEGSVDEGIDANEMLDALEKRDASQDISHSEAPDLEGADDFEPPQQDDINPDLSDEQWAELEQQSSAGRKQTAEPDERAADSMEFHRAMERLQDIGMPGGLTRLFDYLKYAYTDSVNSDTPANAESLDEPTEARLGKLNFQRFCNVCYRSSGFRKYCRVHANTAGKSRVEITRALRFVPQYEAALLKLFKLSATKHASVGALQGEAMTLPQPELTTAHALQTKSLAILPAMVETARVGLLAGQRQTDGLALLQEYSTIIAHRLAGPVTAAPLTWVRIGWYVIDLHRLSNTCESLKKLMAQLLHGAPKPPDPAQDVSHELTVFLAAYCADILGRLALACSNPVAMAAVPTDLHRDFFTQWLCGYTPQHSVGHQAVTEVRDADFVRLQDQQSAFDLDCLWQHFARLTAWRLASQEAPQRKARMRRLPRDEIIKLRDAGQNVEQLAKRFGANVPSVKAALVRWDAEAKVVKASKA